MGMFKRMKDMRDMVEAAPGMVAQAQQLSAQAQQLSAQAQQMAAAQQAAAQARMAAASQMMATQTQAANAAVAAAEGTAGAAAVHRRVTITGMRQIGMMNFDLLVEFELTVLPGGLPPYPATTHQRVSQTQIGRLQPGVTLQASVDPSNPAAIWLDLESVR